MSRATELAEKCGAVVGQSFIDFPFPVFKLTEDELEAFYHAARAEALREAAQRAGTLSVNGVKADHTEWIEEELRAMADREIKQ